MSGRIGGLIACTILTAAFVATFASFAASLASTFAAFATTISARCAL
jgi:hypothetical protein